MSETKYEWPPQVHARLKAERTRLALAHRRGQITRDEAVRMYFDFMVAEMRGSRIEASETIAVQCPQCLVVHRMSRDVKVYRCDCSPNKDRFTFVGRAILGA